MTRPRRPVSSYAVLPFEPQWIAAADAIVLIQEMLDVAPSKARAELMAARQSGAVRSYIGGVQGDSIGVTGFVSAEVMHTHDWLLALNSCEGTVMINTPDLRFWLARPRRGPVPGTINRYLQDDLALIPELKRIMRQERVSPTQAARRLVDRMQGCGSEDSRVRRLVKVFKRQQASRDAA